MSNEDKPKRLGGRKGSSLSLHDRIAQFYYSHGLFCASYPATVISLAIIVALICCYPLLNLPLMASSSVIQSNGTLKINPKYYVQQVVLKTAVIPWADHLVVGDAFRATLYESFKLLDVVRNYQDPISMKTLGHVCLHVESLRKSDLSANVFPEYSCLVLSPANMWKQDVQLFTQDPSILNTIYHYQNLQKGKTSIAEMLFGMHLVDTGIKRYPLRNRQRILQYAVTLFLTEHDNQFLFGLRKKLQTLYPLHQPENITESDPVANTVIIHYPGEMKYLEYVPLLFMYLLLFIYYYFSVRKIEIINSKFGMACTIVLTTISSLLMTLGICFFFGLTLSVHNRKIFPYMVMLLGLENVLVLTKSVVSTPSHLDIKIRVAQGLSKEGWSITKNLCLEITILTIGLFTFVPAIQEICIFSIVGLMADFFLQMLFFSTVLGLDIRQLEKNDTKMQNFRNSFYRNPNYTNEKSSLSRSKSHPRLNSMPTNIVANQQGKLEKRIPKRLRLVNIWARTRFFQRSFMILMCVWIAMILYNIGILEQYFGNDFHQDVPKNNQSKAKEDELQDKKYSILPILNSNDNYLVNYVTEKANLNLQKHRDELNKLKHSSEYTPWLNLKTQHWISILRKYNISLSGEYLAVLPNIKISHAVTPEEAVLLRNADEKYGESFQWQALALALDPIDFSDLDGSLKTQNMPQGDRPFYPTSPMELFLTAILCAISVIVLAYTVFVLYKCICSRNYAEWRASWTSDKSDNENEVPVLLEAVPIVLEGHKQEIECIATDGTSIASTCLGGNLKIWDATSGELVASINRHETSTESVPSTPDDCRLSGSAKQAEDETISFLKKRINLKFAHLKLADTVQNERKFDFGDEYKQILRNRKKDSNHVYTAAQEQKDQVTNETATSAAIWCIDFMDNLVVLGCADGRLEFWEGTTAKFKGVCEDVSGSGITMVKIVGSRVVAARIFGTLDFYQLQTFNQGRAIDWNFTCAYRRTHVRTGSAGSITDFATKDDYSSKEDLRCVKMLSAKAHQQPITCLDCEGGRVLTGSQDHTMKVFRLEDGSHLCTLHGHFGPISCLFIDRINPACSGSGSQDGMLCVWDLLTGACMYSLQAHDGSITSLTYSASYVISLGTDERVCVWERFQGHLLNTFSVHASFSSQIAMLTPHLAVTARNGGLVLWDVRNGDSVKSILFGHSPYVFVKQLIVLRDAVVCDFGVQLRIVRFPVISRKFD